MQIRPMVPTDLNAAVELCSANRWSGLLEQFTFFLAHPFSHPFVAEVDGMVVGTGVGTQRGHVGWISLIAVSEVCRRQGIGQGITCQVRDQLRAAGCRTVLLFATDAGRPLYEKLDFAVDAHYHLMTGPALPQFPDSPHLAPVGPADLPAICALDRSVRSEDRAAELAAYAAGGGWIIRGSSGSLSAFHLRTPWGTSAVTALSPAAGRLMLDVDRAIAAAAGRSTAELVLPGENHEGLAYLQQEGFQQVRRLPRMIWGEPLVWQPEAVWSRVSGALG